jgi:hypothetical protein
MVRGFSQSYNAFRVPGIMADGSNVLRPAVSTLPARIEMKDGVVNVSGESVDGPLTLEIRLAESKSPVIRQTTFPLELIESLAEELGCVRLSDLVQRYQNSKSVSGVLKAQMLSYFRPRNFKESGCWISGAAQGLPPGAWHRCFRTRKLWGLTWPRPNRSREKDRGVPRD